MTHEGLGGLSADARALIEEARHVHDPAPGVQARVRGKLQLSLAAGVGVAGYSALAGATSSKLLAAALTVGLAGSGVWYAHHARVHAHESPVLPTCEPSRPAPTIVAVSGEPTARLAAPRVASRSPASGRVAPSAALSHADGRSGLAEETGVLVLVNSAIQRHDGAAALSLLDDYDRRFKPHILFAERSAARVFALCSLGNSAGAKAEAQRFLRHFPRSPLASRVMASCAQPAPVKPQAP